MNPLSREEVLDWLRNPVTKKVRTKIFAMIEDRKNDWVSGKFNDSLVEAYERGKCVGMAEVFEVEADESYFPEME